MFEHATDIEIDGVGFRHLLTTRHGSATARTAIHTATGLKRLGGVRFVEHGSVEEVAHLAAGMSAKAAAARVPIDGLKCLIECPDGVPGSIAERAALVAAHLRIAIRIDPEIIFGPDMMAPESVLSEVAGEPDLAQHVTGLERRHGGLDIDGNGLTALGVHTAIAIASAKVREPRAAIQGFGAVGAELARLLAAERYRITAISNRLGTLCGGAGVDVAACYAAWREFGDDWIVSDAVCGGMYVADSTAALTTPCDVLVPAARTAVLAANDELAKTARENPDVIAVERLLDAGPPGLIAEAANHPLTERAESLLQNAGVLVLPDTLINCGGMIGCWYEYDNREALRGDEAEYDRALEACRMRIVDVVTQNSRTVIEAFEAGRFAREVANAIAGRPVQLPLYST